VVSDMRFWGNRGGEVLRGDWGGQLQKGEVRVNDVRQPLIPPP
jgi:hypothetical protein